MSIYKELSYDQHIDVVKGIQFGVLGPDEIERRSVAEITNTNTYSGTKPEVGGLFDPRMGVLEHNSYCATCEQKNIFCPGHFGHIKMAKPVFHAMFFDHVKKLLKCVCYRCSRVLVSADSQYNDIREGVLKAQSVKNLAKRNDVMFKLCSGTNTKLKRCGDGNPGGCNAKQPSKYFKDTSLRIFAEWKETKDPESQLERKEFTPEEILQIFQRISEKDMETLGFNPKWNRPEWMICTVLPVPPPAVRPSIIEENGQRREDDLTHKLSDIVKTNNQLKQRIERGNATEEQLRLNTLVLQYHVATFIDNQIPGLPPAQQRNGRRLKSICDRLKKKEGRIRGNLNGKRVDQSSRSVITPDPYISLDELGVPIKIAMNLTFPESINQYNIEEMRKLVRNGPDQWPGAKYVRKAHNGNTFSLRLSEAKRNELAIELLEGDIVDRHLRDGDYVLFNRQPSLHKMSMMCHRVKVMPYQTFRLNVLVTTPYNADFDGDEMNMHACQSIQTMCELMDFASVPYHILTPKDAAPIVEVVQDTMVGVYRLTKDTVFIHDKTMANLQMVNSYFSGQLPPMAQRTRDGEIGYTGHQAYSFIMPPSLYLTTSNKLGNKVIIEDSILKEGNIDKSVFTKMSTGILPVLYHDYGPFEVRRFLDNTQRLMCRWLMTAGFSVGISDLIAEDEILTRIRTTIQDKKQDAYRKVEDVRKGVIVNNSMMNNADFLEMEVINVLNEMNKEIGKLCSASINDDTNRMMNMIKSGSKGKDQNVAQMIANVGQQNVDGKRVAYGFTDRTLPHYTKFDDGPDARGFVENSFISGLTPQEVFFHAMGGREGLIDTAVKTSETGYIQRRLVKAMEDCKIYYDQTVRNASGAIVQFLYGEDGMEGTKIEIQKVNTIDMDPLTMDMEYHLRSTDDFELHVVPDALKAIKSDEGDWMNRSQQHFEAMVKDRLDLIRTVFQNRKEDSILYPIPFSRILRTAHERIKKVGLEGMPTDLTPGYVLDKIDHLISTLYVTLQTQGTQFLHILLRTYLAPKKMIFKYHFSKDTFDWIVSEVQRCFQEAVAPAGEMVGIIAAQSLGEPSTQLTLDSFHVSGTAAAVKATKGVPRLKELLSVSHNIKTPSMTIYLKPDIASVVDPQNKEDESTKEEIKDPLITEAKERADKIRGSLEITRLSDMLDITEIYWDPPGESGYETGIEKDKGFLDVYHAFETVNKCSSTSPWVLRMKVNKEKLYQAHLTMMDVYMKLFEAQRTTMQCVFSDDNAEELIFRVRLAGTSKVAEEGDEEIVNDDQIATLKALEHNLVHTVLLKGVQNVKKVSMRLQTMPLYIPEMDAFRDVSQWILETDGSNLLDILTNPNVDATQTRSNDVWEIFKAYGIEAARTAMFNEIMEVIKESSVNYRHVAMLIDTMTHKGSLMSIDRHGINRGDAGPLSKCSFEESTDMLINASVFSEFDRINGVSANIMLGQLAPCGTGDSEVLLDEDRYLAILSALVNSKMANRVVQEDDDFDGADPVYHMVPACDVTEMQFHHKMPQKQNLGARMFELPDAPF